MDNEQQRQYWEKRIDRFDAIYDDNKGLREITWLSKLVEPYRRRSITERFQYASMVLRDVGIGGKTFIDGGCGTGRMASYLLSEGARKVYAVDITKRALDLARQRMESEHPTRRGDIEYVEGDITSLRLPAVDCLVGLGLVEYLSDIRTFLANVRGICRYALVNYPSRYHWKRAVRMVVEYFEKSTRHYYSASQMGELFSAVGFRRMRSIPFGASILELYGK
jgi:ubiquinone/menaquinone biosynthesis C-methylase UbiE